jgi:hypothetical protein
MATLARDRFDDLGLDDSILKYIPNENAQSPDQHADQWNPSNQNLAQWHLSRRVSFRRKDGKVGAAVRADFCRLVDFFIAFSAGIHRISDTFP